MKNVLKLAFATVALAFVAGTGAMAGSSPGTLVVNGNAISNCTPAVNAYTMTDVDLNTATDYMGTNYYKFPIAIAVTCSGELSSWSVSQPGADPHFNISATPSGSVGLYDENVAKMDGMSGAPSQLHGTGSTSVNAKLWFAGEGGACTVPGCGRTGAFSVAVPIDVSF